MPYIPPDPSPDTVAAVALLLYALAFRARQPVRIPRQALWDHASASFPALVAAVGSRLDFYAVLRLLAARHPDAIREVTGTGSRRDLVLDPAGGARSFGVYRLGADQIAEEAHLQRRGLQPTRPLPEGLAVAAPIPRPPDGPKTCTGCRVLKPAADFNRRGPNGLQSRCRGCQRAAARGATAADS